MSKEKKKSNFKDKLQKVVSSTKEAVKEIDFSETKGKIQKVADSTVEAVKNINLPKVDKDKIKSIFSKKESAKAVFDSETVEIIDVPAISTKSAIKIIFYLMAADGEVYHSEEEKFDSIGTELDPTFLDNKNRIVNECKKQLDKVIDYEDYYETLKEGIDAALNDSKITEDTFITPKLLVWNLLAIAYSDENYDETERKLIKYIVRKTNIDKAIFLEMESSFLTLVDIEKELEWIKTTNRPYLTIEAMVNELMDRKNVIFESVKDLITL